MQRVATFSFVFAAVFAVCGCASEVSEITDDFVGEDAAPLGAAIATSGFPAVVEVLPGHCSGTVVGDHQVLTSAHCFHSGFTYPPLPHRIRFADGREVAARATHHPASDWTNPTVPNLTLLTFDEPALVTPMRISTAPIGVGAAVTLVGLGIDAPGGVAGKHFVGARVAEIDAYGMRFEAGTQICDGDAGGAVFVRLFNEYALAGVLAPSPAGGCSVTPLATRLDRQRDWLLSAAVPRERLVASPLVAVRVLDADVPALSSTAAVRYEIQSYGRYLLNATSFSIRAGGEKNAVGRTFLAGPVFVRFSAGAAAATPFVSRVTVRDGTGATRVIDVHFPAFSALPIPRGFFISSDGGTYFADEGHDGIAVGERTEVMLVRAALSDVHIAAGGAGPEAGPLRCWPREDSRVSGYHYWTSFRVSTVESLYYRDGRVSAGIADSAIATHCIVSASATSLGTCEAMCFADIKHTNYAGGAEASTITSAVMRIAPVTTDDTIRAVMAVPTLTGDRNIGSASMRFAADALGPTITPLEVSATVQLYTGGGAYPGPLMSGQSCTRPASP